MESFGKNAEASKKKMEDTSRTDSKGQSSAANNKMLIMLKYNKKYFLLFLYMINFA